MNYSINWRNSEQISESEYRTFTENILVDENTTIGEIHYKVHHGRIDRPLHVEINSFIIINKNDKPDTK